MTVKSASDKEKIAPAKAAPKATTKSAAKSEKKEAPKKSETKKVETKKTTPAKSEPKKEVEKKVVEKKPDVKVEKSEQFLSAGKIAEKLGVSPGKIKKAVQEQSIQPDLVKGGCSMYSNSTIKKIEKAVK